MRTLKQRWQSERCFQNKGSLAGIRSRLSQIAISNSTLPHERDKLAKVLTTLDDIIHNWDNYPEHSWKLFERRPK